jgi:TolA-binding protein
MKVIKLIAYIVLSACLIFFGKAFLSEYNRVTEQSAAKGVALSIDDIDPPNYSMPVAQEEVSNDQDKSPSPAADSNSDSAPLNTPDIEINESPENQEASSTERVDNEAPSEESAAEVSNRLGFYGGGFVFILLALGLLTGYDLTRFSANRAVNALYSDDGGGMEDSDLYESAEQEWARGDFLEAIRILRDYLAANPKQQHAAIRIAEIYEKDLKNPLAAALEYEEILTQKLTPDRWGWSAIHLANLYSGPMNKPDKAIELLRELVERYPETSAAEKASQRLNLIDGSSEE